MTRRTRPLPAGSTGILLSLLLAATLGATPALARGRDASDSTLMVPQVDPHADAEVIRWKFDVVDAVVAQGFMRTIDDERTIKVFTARGAREQAEASIPYFDGMRIEDLLVRVTSPDGHRQTIHPEKMYDRVLYRIGKHSVRVRTFALPGVVAGSLIEYSTQLSILDPFHLVDLWLPCQLNIPVRDFELSMRPWVQQDLLLRLNRTSEAIQAPTRDAAGFLHARVRNLPAYHEEPFSPSEAESRLTVFGHYVDQAGTDTMRDLLTSGNNLSRGIDFAIQHAPLLHGVLAQAVAGATSADDRLRAIYRYCRTQLHNVDLVNDSLSAAVAQQGPPDQLINATLHDRAGTSTAINMTFVALARLSSLDARLALTIPGAYSAFDASLPATLGFEHALAAVKGPGGWVFYDPGHHWMACGQPSWQDEGDQAMVVESNSWMSRVPESPAESTLLVRVADLRLDTEGAVAGEVSCLRTGHLAARWRESQAGLTPAEREKLVADELRGRFPSAELDSLQLADADDPEPPCVTHYRVRVPEFAQQAGARWVFTPGFFQHDLPALLARTDRTQPVVMPHAWTEIDTVRVWLPPGTKAELTPGGTTFPLLDVGQCSVELRPSPAGTVVLFVRRVSLETPHSQHLAVERYGELVTALERAQQVGNVRVMAAPAGSTR